MRSLLLAAAVLALPQLLFAQTAASADSARRAKECPSCAEWNAPQAPFRIHGNTYYVGTRGLSAILVTSDAGHVLVDSGLPESAPLIEANIRALGFRIQDVKLILNSHAHFDHAGGAAELQRASGAEVAATEPSARMLRAGGPTPDDPQYGEALPYPVVSQVRVFQPGDTLRIGPNALVAHLTAGHTPGGTTWTWRSCEGENCLDIVYADSQTPISADDFYFTRSRTYTTGVEDFRRGHATIEQLRCDILIAPHPGAVRLFERAGNFVDRSACVRYAENARKQLAERLAKEGL